MQARAAARKADRRLSLVAAAAAVFAERGVEATTVDDIVRAAGAAKGTFYLYFGTKDEAVAAVAEQLVERTGEVMAAGLAREGSAHDRLLELSRAINGVGAEPGEQELVEVLHRPGNRGLHDRIGGLVTDRLAPAVSRVIAEGIGAGEFERQDPDRTARFVLACFGALHDRVTTAEELASATAELDAFVLRGLGWRERPETPRKDDPT